MTNMGDVSSELWSELHGAGVAFRDLKAWTWMYDSDLFGVQCPDTGQIGYCAIMGNLGQVFALNVYLGSEGLAGYWTMVDRSDALESTRRALAAVAGHQLCLMASFEDRAELDRRDLAVIKGLGLRFRGRNQWPVFRSHRPGYLPWFLETSEVQFLTVALRQAMEVAQAVKRDPDYLEDLAPGEDTHVLRLREGEVWRNVVHTPEPAEESAPPAHARRSAAGEDPEGRAQPRGGLANRLRAGPRRHPRGRTTVLSCRLPDRERDGCRPAPRDDEPDGSAGGGAEAVYGVRGRTGDASRSPCGRE